MGVGFLDALKDHESWIVVIYRLGNRSERSFGSSSEAVSFVDEPMNSADSFIEKIYAPDGFEYWNPYFTDGRQTWEELKS